jgi:hypothetical protein
METLPQRFTRISKFYLRWVVAPWVAVVVTLLVADAIWRAM